MELGNPKQMMEEAYKDKPLHSDKNNLLEEFCDMLICGALIAEWDVKEVKCNYRVNVNNNFWTVGIVSEWNQDEMRKIIDKHGIPRNPSIKECVFQFIDMGLFIIVDGKLITNRRNYPNIIDMIAKICEERIKQDGFN